MNKQKMILITVSLIVFATLSLFAWYIFSQKSPNPMEKMTGTEPESSTPSSNTPSIALDNNSSEGSSSMPSEATFSTAIIESNPSLVDEETNLPNFTIQKTREPLPGWYVVDIKNTAVTTSNAIVVMRNINNKLQIVAGPGTGLTLDESLPEEVREVLY